VVTWIFDPPLPVLFPVKIWKSTENNLILDKRDSKSGPPEYKDRVITSLQLIFQDALLGYFELHPSLPIHYELTVLLNIKFQRRAVGARLLHTAPAHATVRLRFVICVTLRELRQTEQLLSRIRPTSVTGSER
jgi:hypothetical protein